MSPIATPIMRGPEEYRGQALSQLRILKQQMEISGLKVGRREVSLGDGIKCYCEICFNYELVYIVMPDKTVVVVKGFLTHPRNGVVRGFQFPGTDANETTTFGLAHTGKGYSRSGDIVTDDGDEVGVSSGNPFPVIDGDGKQYHFSKTPWKANGPIEMVYGNVDWKGPRAVNPEDRKVLTYKGNPSRYWPVPQFTLIPGLSKIDHTITSVSGDYSYTTVFSEFVYEGGSVVATMPSLYAPTGSENQPAQVLGAAYRSGVMICIVKTCYNNNPGYPGYPGPGYYFEVLKKVNSEAIPGWTRMLRVSTGTNMPNCNFFFSEDGTKAVSVMLGKVWTVEIGEESATCNDTPVGEFQEVIATTKVSTNPEVVPWEEGMTPSVVGSWRSHTITTRTYSQTKSGTKVIAADYKGNVLVTATATISGGAAYTWEREYGTKWGTTAQIPELTEPSDRIPTISWGFCDAGVPGSFGITATALGACQPTLTINGLPAVSGGCTAIELPDICVDGTVPVSVSLVDAASGLSAVVSGDYRYDGIGHWDGGTVIQADSQTGCFVGFNGIFVGGTVPQISNHDPENCYYAPGAPEAFADKTCTTTQVSCLANPSCTYYDVTIHNYATSGATWVGGPYNGTCPCPEFSVGSYTTPTNEIFWWYDFKVVTRYRWVCT